MEFADRGDVILFSGLPGKSPEQAAKDRAKNKAQAEAAAKARAKAEAERKKKQDKGKNDEPTDTSEGGVSNRTMGYAKELEDAKKRGTPAFRIKLIEDNLKKSKLKDQKAEDARKKRNRNKRLDDYTNWTGWGTLNVPKVGTVYVNTPVLPYGTSFV